MSSTELPLVSRARSPASITAPPRLITSQATSIEMPSCRPNTPNAPNKLSDAPIHHVPVRPESGEPSQQAKVAGTRPKPNSHSAEGSSLNAIRCDASANGKSTRGVAVGKASRQATTLSTQPAVSEYLTNARTRRSGERMAAVSHSALAARIRSALKLPSSHPLLGATEEQQQRVNDGCGVRRTPG